MGWFSKAVPRRKWQSASAALGQELQVMGSSWYSAFQRGTAACGFGLAAKMSNAAQHHVSMLQLSAVAATLQENSYVSDTSLSVFLELVYIILTKNPPAGLHHEIGTLPFARAGDARKALGLWARSMAAVLSPDKDDPRLTEELNRYGALLVIQAKIATCEACDDPKGAEKVRKVFES